MYDPSRDSASSMMSPLKVAGASLDVYPSEPPPPELEELVKHPNVVCSPHLGASTQDAQVCLPTDVLSRSRIKIHHKKCPRGFDVADGCRKGIICEEFKVVHDPGVLRERCAYCRLTFLAVRPDRQ